MSVFLSHTTKCYPKLPYEAIATAILGARYDVSLVFVGDKRAQKLNQDTRGKEYIPNVLSFPLADSVGEIYIAPTVAKREAHKFSMTFEGYIGFLFIHGCLHLKGHAHGDEMDTLEKKYCKKFGLT